MAIVPVGFNGAISPKLDVCVSQDCNTITFSDVTLLSSIANPYGWTTDLSEVPRPRILTAFKEIRVIAQDSSGNEILNLIVYNSPAINFFPSVADFNDNMPLSTAVWGQDDGLYSFTYQFTYQDSPGLIGDGANQLALAGNVVEQKFNKLISCNAANTVKDLWLKYLNNCCSSNKNEALEAEALLFAVEAAGACADEFSAGKIKEALDKILTIGSSSCNLCKSTKCKC
tara:strand:+ start:1848 stop:2531 length:684 start_codon:yes stop_codon:yes gene_type:complete